MFLAFVDLGLTSRLGYLLNYLEANPLYPYIGLWGIAAVNIVLLIGIYTFYGRSKNVTTRFAIFNSMMTLVVIRIFVIINNWKVLQNPPTLEVAQAITVEFKRQAVLNLVVPFVIPYIIAVLTFIFFTYDHKVVVKL